MTGVRRAISSCASGRDFLSQFAFSELAEIGRSHFFDTLKNGRRLRLCKGSARAKSNSIS